MVFVKRYASTIDDFSYFEPVDPTPRLPMLSPLDAFHDAPAAISTLTKLIG
jgi:hypothetical protein